MGEGDSGRDRAFVVDFAAGSRVAGYRLEQEIGRGGMAVVFRARDERLGRRVALKILAPALAADEAFQQRFIRESRAAASVDDPHIVPVFEAGESDGVLFIAMRYVRGGDVRSLVRREGPMPPERAAAIISPVASALDAAHAAGLLHRDVKPANMLLDAVPGRPDHVYLSDFGLSKAAGTSTGLTGTGQFLGTLDYISPEQVQGGPVDGRADQYALACSAFELLTGGPPFRYDEAMALMHAQLLDPPPKLTSRRPDLPPAADEVLDRALAKAPQYRYPSCRDFAEALRGAFGLQSYDSGSRPVLTADHPQTQVGGPARVSGSGNGGRTAGEAAAAAPTVLPPGTGHADLPTSTGEASIPPPPPPATGPAYPSQSVGDGGERQRARRRRVRIGAAALAIVVLAAAGVTAALLAHHPAPPVPEFSPVAAKSAYTPLSGDIYVEYRGGSQANAELSGEIKHVTSGEVAQLYAQQFPFSRAPVLDGSVILHPSGTTARYTFQVTPVLATRYKVEVFGSSTATTPLASSATRTVYVSLNGMTGNGQTCGRPVCRETYVTKVLVPPSALSTELSKAWYAYFAVNLSPTKTPPAPTVLVLDGGDAHVFPSQRLAGDEFEYTVTFAFQIGNDGSNWTWTGCDIDTEAADGVGLPGRHGCGDQSVLASAPYLG